jgi:copper chaperone CopZ
MTKITLDITGMSCGHCVASVSRTLKGIEGVHVDEVRIGSATVEFDESKTTTAAVAKAVTDEGYAVVGTR